MRRLKFRRAHSGARGIDQDALEANVKQIVLAAYQLDNYGDIGDGPKVQEAFVTFNAAITALDSLVSGETVMRRSAAGMALSMVAACPLAWDAHKGITSKFTYNAEVYPIFLNRCGRCHVEGGVGPMSLLTIRRRLSLGRIAAHRAACCGAW